MQACADLREERKQSTVLDGHYKKMISEERKQSEALDDHYKKKFYALEEKAEIAEASAASFYEGKLKKEEVSY